MEQSKWVGGFAEWTEGDTAYLSVAFTWLLDKAYARALWYRALGYRVRAGGPALFLVKMQHELADVAELGGDAPDAIARHNPAATIASRGCSVGCWFCIVPAMEGREFTLLPDFPVRPVLCDNNLSALPPDYQQHIIDHYKAVPPDVAKAFDEAESKGRFIRESIRGKFDFARIEVDQEAQPPAAQPA